MEKKTVGELDVEVFFEAMQSLLVRKSAGGEDRVGDLTVKDFTAMMVDQLRNRSVRTAQVEADTAQRIIQDWEGLKEIKALAQPFRVTNIAEVVDLAQSMRESFESYESTSFGAPIQLVVAVAVVANDKYRSVKK